MQTYYFDKIEEIKVPQLILALGTFDGLHLGHQLVIKTAVNKAKEMGLAAGVFTFQPHPLQIIKPQNQPPLLCSYAEKEELIAAMGVDYYLIQKFSPEFAKVDYQEFIQSYLLQQLKIKGLVVGSGFHFGYLGQGTSKILKNHPALQNIEVEILEPFKKDGVNISSTLIRRLIYRGEVNKVARFLGRNFSLKARFKKSDFQSGHCLVEIRRQANQVQPPVGFYAVAIKKAQIKKRFVLRWPVVGVDDFSTLMLNLYPQDEQSLSLQFDEVFDLEFCELLTDLPAHYSLTKATFKTSSD